MDMDLVVVAVMSIIVTFIAAGAFVVRPLFKQLSQVMEEWVRDRRLGRQEGAGADPAVRSELERLRDTLDDVQRELSLLRDRQEFTESLLESGRRSTKPSRKVAPEDRA